MNMNVSGNKTSRIRILFLIDQLLGFGGTETHLTQIVMKLNKDKFLCKVCPFESKPNPNWQKIHDAGIPIFPLPIKRFYDFKGICQAFRLSKFIKENRFDFVQTFYFTSDTYGAIVSRLAGVPFVISSRRDMDAYKGTLQLLFCRFANHFIDYFIAVCDAVHMNFSSRELVPDKKIRRIYNGVDLSEFQLPTQKDIQKRRMQFGIDEKTFVIGNVSRFRPEKDHDTFIEAIKLVCSSIPNLKVILVGDGQLMKDLQNTCREHSILSHAVVFTGGISNVRDYVSIFDIACLTPAKNEGLSNAILENMAMGKPIIATDVGGNAEIIVQNESGIIIPPNDKHRLAEAIILLYRNKELREKMGMNVRRRVEDYFDVNTMIGNLENMYFEVFNSGNGGKHIMCNEEKLNSSGEQK